MGQVLKDNQTFDPFALFVVKRLRDPNYPPITMDWLDHVESNPKSESAEAKNDEGRPRNGRE